MFSGTTYTIRLATPIDEPALLWLADIDSQGPLRAGPVLLGEIDGKPQAAISLADARVIANPFLPTAHLLAHIRMRASALGALERTPSVSTRIRAALSNAVVARRASTTA